MFTGRLWTAVAPVAMLLGIASAASATDDFKCYKVKDLKAPKFQALTLASLEDQFDSETGVEVKKPFLLCNPVSRDGVPIAQPAEHLLCYKAKSRKLSARPHVEAVNQLGTVQLEVKKPYLVCVPSSKTILPSPTSGDFLALSYNVAGLPEGISGSHPATNTAIIGPLLNDYDLVLVQESWKTPDPNPLAPLRVYHEILEASSTHPFRSVSAEQPVGTDPFRPSAILSDGLNRFSQFRFDDVIRQRWASCHNSAADCFALKGFSVARTTFPGGASIDVYNLHGEAGGDPQDDLLRDAGVTQLSNFMSVYSAGRAVIVGGDFNLHTDEEPDSTQFQRLLSETGLSDVCATLSCPEPGRIDKFLFRSGGGVTIAPLSWNFETEVFIDGNGDPLSDHEPLAVRFQWSVVP